MIPTDEDLNKNLDIIVKKLNPSLWKRYYPHIVDNSE
jgi:hypothetical protein